MTTIFHPKLDDFLKRQSTTSEDRNFRERIEARIFLEEVSQRDNIRTQSSLEENVNPSILKDDPSSRSNHSIFTWTALELFESSGSSN